MNNANDTHPNGTDDGFSPSHEELLFISHQPQYHIIGDVYVDILCYIPSSPTVTSNHDCSRTATTNNTTTSVVLNLDGTDTALNQPITIMAGGSTLNTATYLQYLQQHRHQSTLTTTPTNTTRLPSSSSSSSSSPPPKTSLLDITVHTVFNPNDYYGSILIQHSDQHHIVLRNCYSDDDIDNSHIDNHDVIISADPSIMTSQKQKHSPSRGTHHTKQLSTPHCMVMISSSSSSNNLAMSSVVNSNGEILSTTTPATMTTTSSERTFLTHRGCATNKMHINDLFPTLSPPSPLDGGVVEQKSNGGSIIIVPPKHYHIAGYYCTPELWNTHHDCIENSALLSFVKSIYAVPKIPTNENGWSLSIHSSNFTNTESTTFTHAPIVLSLVTQYDATQQWDISNLLSILPYMHICIMNELEAQQIYSRNYQDRSTKKATGQSSDIVNSVLIDIISFFTEFNASTIYVITQGVKGAIAFRNKTIIAQVNGTINVNSIVTTNFDISKSDMIIDPTGAGDAFCAGFFHSLWQSIQHSDLHVTGMHLHKSTSDSLYVPSEHYWPNATAIQDALLLGCTVGTCSVLQKGGSIVPSSDSNLVQIVHEQYKKLYSPLLNATSQQR